MMVDLHVHTQCSSDGQYAPQEILTKAHGLGITSLAFTDHMDIRACRQEVGGTSPELLVGVEISTRHLGREQHLLLYGFDPDDGELEAFLDTCCRALWDEITSVLKEFQALGFDIERTDVADWGRSVPTGVSLLRALLRRNAADSRLQPYLKGDRADSPYLHFYQDYLMGPLGESLCARLPGLVETLARFRGMGVPVLAHPGGLEYGVLAELGEAGLEGLEAFSSHHDAAIARTLERTARRLGLLVSAGSDFHGELIKPRVRLGSMTGQPDEALLERIRGQHP